MKKVRKKVVAQKAYLLLIWNNLKVVRKGIKNQDQRLMKRFFREDPKNQLSLETLNFPKQLAQTLR
jgi:hypothetical protein